ncbi:MAG: AsnC family transcriptional regulator, partial [bacterium]|nr:AsnC family transcriptional regulator [bacterium]
LKKKKKKVVLLSMDDDGNDLDEEKVKGKKVLLVDNDVVTGKGYKRSMEAMRTRKARLRIKDIRFATFFDRVGVADFSVERYSPEAIWNMQELDAPDLKILQFLSQNGRAAFAAIGEKIKLSPVAVRNRVEKLLKEKVLRVQGTLNIDQFFTMAAHVEVEADEKTIEELIEKLEQMHEVYHLAKVAGRWNLLIGLLANTLENVEEFVEREIRILPGVKHIDVHIGDLPVVPKAFSPRL